jgi:hypothetical protein
MEYLEDCIENTFNPELMTDKVQFYHDLIQPYVDMESNQPNPRSSGDTFEKSGDLLLQHTLERVEATREFLAGQK